MELHLSVIITTDIKLFFESQLELLADNILSIYGQATQSIYVAEQADRGEKEQEKH